VAVLAYLLRHGNTDLSPAPEYWLPVPLNRRGREDASAGGTHLYNRVMRDGANFPMPVRITASDLVRTKETAVIARNALHLSHVPIGLEPGLRAYNPAVESAEQYQERSDQAIRSVLTDSSVALIVGHRSTSGFLDQAYGAHKFDETWVPDYRHFRLLHEGGVLAITDDGLVPVFRCARDSWPSAHEVINLE